MTDPLQAFFNAGRWLYICPRCAVPLPAEKDICPRCWPDALAKAYQMGADNLLRAVPDPIKREQARSQAESAGELYTPVFPEEKQEIEHILRYRPVRSMHWEPGDSVEKLLAQNLAHGDEVPPKYRSES